MNKRARQRLIGVTVLIVIIIGAIIFGSSMTGAGGAYKKSIADVRSDKELVGKQVQVEGPVVKGSWTPGASPFVFSIGDKDDPNAEGLEILWDRPVPSAFGDGTTAIVTGIVNDDMSVTAKTLITQCPSKYASATDALTVDALLSSTLGAATVKITGYIVNGSIKPSGSAERFVVGTLAAGGESVPVLFDGALPQGVEDGAKVVVTGSLEDNGIFNATDLALDEAQKK